MNDIDGAIARLDDYLRSPASNDADDAYEEALFQRALSGDAPELGFLGALEATLRVMDARGSLDLWLTARDVERVRASGLRTVMFEIDPADPRTPVIPPDADLLITRVPLDLSGVRTLDVEIVTQDGRPVKWMPDVSFDPADGAVYACCEADLARTASSVRSFTRLWASDASGRRLLAELPSV